MKAILQVKGMHCRSCEMLIEESVKELEGVEKIKVDHQKGQALISYDERKITLGAIKMAIIKEGYKVD
ncbi:MAG: heavy-metal-associated domain-containing protein [archaeon]